MSIQHFGINLNENKLGYRLNKDNFAITSNKSSFVSGKIYTEEWCKNHYDRCMQNYEINMNRLKSLNKQDFNNQLNNFLEQYPYFELVEDLKKYEKVSGYYIMVLDDYCQVYFGTSTNIKQRIISHWNKIMPFDRVIFGNINNSIISIDSYRALDTTRIYAYKTEKIYDNENDYINSINPEYCCNRTKGGKLNSLQEAIQNRKTHGEKNEEKCIHTHMLYVGDGKNMVPVKDKIYFSIEDLEYNFGWSKERILNWYIFCGFPLEFFDNGENSFFLIDNENLMKWVNSYKETCSREDEKDNGTALAILSLIFIAIIIVEIVVIVTFICL